MKVDIETMSFEEKVALFTELWEDLPIVLNDDMGNAHTPQECDAVSIAEKDDRENCITEGCVVIKLTVISE